MSVRSSILALLTLGPAYGLQLHAEIEARTARTGRINVGQIYSTLNRLVGAGLVVPLVPPGPLVPLVPPGAALAPDTAADDIRGAVTEPDTEAGAEARIAPASVPHYELTTEGRAEAAVWLAAPSSELPSWEEMVEHVLLASSLPEVDLHSLVLRYRVLWTPAVQSDATRPRTLASAARHHLSAAALEWLEEVDRQLHSGAVVPYGFSAERPRRGRRPAVAR